MFKKIKIILDMVKFQHSIFALPFAFIGAFLAENKIPKINKLFWILTATVAARNVAMAFNRLVDKDIDAKNPRTKHRALPKGLISENWVIGFIIFCALVFLFSAYNLNKLVFYLSPFVLIFIMFYSYTKRFSWLSHIFLGISDGFAPFGGYLAIKPKFSILSFLLLFGVAFWVAGFDIIYSCLDYEFDKKEGLYSIPVRFGVRNALYISLFFHILTIVCLYLIGKIALLKPIYFYILIIISFLLIFEHFLIKENNFSLINLAFFKINGIISIFAFLAVLLSI